MSEHTDIELIEEMKKRFEEKNKALYDLRMITRKLEDVNKKLQESEAVKSNFLSNIRNEINNPLTSILVMADDIASGKGVSCEECAAMAGIIYTEAFNLDFQLRNIFVAAEIEAGEAFPAISNVDVYKLILGVIETYGNLAKQKQVTISFDWASESADELFFKTDAEKLQTIVSNLLSNAVKYSPEGSKVMVKAWRHEGHLNILQEDSGIGIDESDQQAIFERFRQIESGSTKSYSGHGLGLSVTKALVELLNGTISVASIKGKGSIFTVLIPESKAEAGVDVFSDEGNEFIFEDQEKF
jgi:signal transduction histidine kinase